MSSKIVPFDTTSDITGLNEQRELRRKENASVERFLQGLLAAHRSYAFYDGKIHFVGESYKPIVSPIDSLKKCIEPGTLEAFLEATNIVGRSSNELERNPITGEDRILTTYRALLTSSNEYYNALARATQPGEPDLPSLWNTVMVGILAALPVYNIAKNTWPQDVPPDQKSFAIAAVALAGLVGICFGERGRYTSNKDAIKRYHEEIQQNLATLPEKADQYTQSLDAFCEATKSVTINPGAASNAIHVRHEARYDMITEKYNWFAGTIELARSVQGKRFWLDLPEYVSQLDKLKAHVDVNAFLKRIAPSEEARHIGIFVESE